MTREQMIEVLRQAYRELEGQALPSDDLGDVILALALEWGIELRSVEDGAG